MALGDKLATRFARWQERFDAVDNSRNLGAMAAFELVTDKRTRTPDPELAKAVCQAAKEHHLILLPCGYWGNSIRILVPLTVSDAVLEEGLDIIESCLAQLTEIKVEAVAN